MGTPKVPKPPPAPPPAPDLADDAVLKAKREARRRQQLFMGRQGTFKTGSGGLTGQAPTATHTLLGQ